jgi:hypothetical protein
MLGAGTPRELNNRAEKLVLRLLEWLTSSHRPDGAVESSTIPILAFSGTNHFGKPQYCLAWNSATSTTGWLLERFRNTHRLFQEVQGGFFLRKKPLECIGFDLYQFRKRFSR